MVVTTEVILPVIKMQCGLHFIYHVHNATYPSRIPIIFFNLVSELLPCLIQQNHEIKGILAEF